MIEIRDYLEGRQTNPIEEWLMEQSEKARAAIEARLLWMSNTPIPWSTAYVFKLRGHDRIWEVRVKHGGQQYRPLGFFGPERDQFTLLIGAKEKNHRFVPPNAPDTAESRIARLLNGRSTTREHFGD